MMPSRDQMLITGLPGRSACSMSSLPGTYRGDAVLRFHPVPQARAGQRRQKQRIEIVQAVLVGRLGDPLADARFIHVQTDDKRTTTRMLCRCMRRTEAQKSRPFRRLNFLPSSRSPSGVGVSKPMKTPLHPAFAANARVLRHRRS